MKLLNSLVEFCIILEKIGTLDVQIQNLALNSKEITQNGLFFAVRGTLTDGHKYINNAIEKGASAIICEEFPENIQANITYIKVENSAQTLGWVAHSFFDKPSEKLKLIGITGTNGKTTTATLCFTLFRELGYSCGLISTIQNQINEKIIPSTHTTPDAIALNTLLAAMVSEKCEYVFMEVSSHAVSQFRINGITFSGGVFTNITQDHMDFHGDMKNYIKAKKGFFDQLPLNSFALINADDRNGIIMLQNTVAKKVSYGIHSFATYKAKILSDSLEGLHIVLDTHEIWCRLIGKFNAYNLLATYSIALQLKQPSEEVLKVLSDLKPVEGRFEQILSPCGYLGIVDYAHTPDALENVLQTINEFKKIDSKIITVFGCGGDRDSDKRSKMAKIAAQMSDIVILTSDNPRSEEPLEIITQMEKGLPSKTHYFIIEDRKEALKKANSLAKSKDIVLVAGKGHEKYQEIKGIRYPFDDVEELRKIMNSAPSKS